MSPQMVTGQETSTSLLSYNIESNATSTLTLDKELRYGFKLVAINSKIFNKNEDLQDQTLTNNVDDDDKNDDFMIIMKVFLMNMSGTPPPFSSMPESKNSFFARSSFLESFVSHLVKSLLCLLAKRNYVCLREQTAPHQFLHPPLNLHHAGHPLMQFVFSSFFCQNSSTQSLPCGGLDILYLETATVCENDFVIHLIL